MALQRRRSVVCDIEGCGCEYIEEEYGAGFPNWCIIQGIAATEPKNPEKPLPEEMTMYLCPRHKLDLANAIDEINKEEQTDRVPKVPVPQGSLF